MRPTGWLLLASGFAIAAVWLVTTALLQPRPSLRRMHARLHRAPTGVDHRIDTSGVVGRLGRAGLRSEVVRSIATPATTLRLIGRSPQEHVGLMIVAAGAGFLAPSFVALVLSQAGVIGFGVAVPLALALAGAVLGPLAVHADAVTRADDVRNDLRHQLSAYLDMVTMLLAGNTGHEGALEIAAAAGDGMLFRELRRRMREVATSGRSLVDALALVGADYELVELEQVAATTALSAAEGAPVARTLAAKCSTLRSTIATDHEARARIRTDKVTPPLVGMALLFMALIIYPALDIG